MVRCFVGRGYVLAIISVSQFSCVGITCCSNNKIQSNKICCSETKICFCLKSRIIASWTQILFPKRMFHGEGGQTQFLHTLFLMRFSMHISIAKIKHVVSTAINLFALCRTICAIFLHNWVQYISDVKNPVILSFLVVTKGSQLNTAQLCIK